MSHTVPVPAAPLLEREFYYDCLYGRAGVEKTAGIRETGQKVLAWLDAKTLPMAAAMEKRQAEAVGQQKWVQETLMSALERNTMAMQSIVAGRRGHDGHSDHDERNN